MPSRAALRRSAVVARKEVLHILRDPATLLIALIVPIVELFLLGYGINTNVRRIRTVVLDQARTEESQSLLDSFRTSDDFALSAEVFSEEGLNRAIIAGEARVGIKIPADYSRRVQAGETATVLILVDGSESSVASEAVNVSNALLLREALNRVLGERTLPVAARPRILFNPDTRSANFFLPGLLVLLVQIMAVVMTANAVVREKENGTLEQLFMLPLRSAELIAGKLFPYLVLALVEFCVIALLMRVVFAVPIHGSFFTLLAVGVPFTLTMLGLGLLISTSVSTRDAAGQMAMSTIIPSIFLSGYIFPIDSMPRLFWWLAQFVPTTWLIDASRSVILRGAGWPQLWKHFLVLWGMAIPMLVLSTQRFRKRV